jgi:hypothetical protein
VLLSPVASPRRSLGLGTLSLAASGADGVLLCSPLKGVVVRDGERIAA